MADPWDRAGQRQVGGVETFIGLARAGVPEVFMPLLAIAPCQGKPAQAAALTQAYRHLRATNLSQALLARHPEALMVLVAPGISWCDWGDPERILLSLQRFDRRPAWLPVYARAQAAGAGRMTPPEPGGKDTHHATV